MTQKEEGPGREGGGIEATHRLLALMDWATTRLVPSPLGKFLVVAPFVMPQLTVLRSVLLPDPLGPITAQKPPVTLPWHRVGPMKRRGEKKGGWV